MARSKVSVADLLEARLLRPGTKLVWKRRLAKPDELAIVQDDGSIRTRLGVYGTPSAAAKELNDNKPTDGWILWRIPETGQRLADLREVYRS